MVKNLTIPGWQSWSPTTPNFLSKFARHFYSPHHQTSWAISLPSTKKTFNPIAGWCSFYCYGKSITESKILTNAQVLSSQVQTDLPKYVVIDDGWNSQTFPSGMKYLSQKIKSFGLKPGLWLSPLLTNTPKPNRLRVFPFNYINDLEDPQTLKQILENIKIIVEDWGYELIKLDFLYAQHHLPRYTNPKTPDQVLASFLSTIKNSYPHVHLNLCGCPLGPAVGVADSMRISADIIAPQLDNLPLINKLYNSSRLNQLASNLESRFLSHQLWLLDPDVFVCRTATGFDLDQVLQLQTLIKKANGVYFLGDDLTKLSPTQISTYIAPMFS